ncbi:MAG: SLC13 family permease [Acidobacteriota bacterium]
MKFVFRIPARASDTERREREKVFFIPAKYYDNLLFWLFKRKWLWIATFAGLTAALLPSPQGLNPYAQYSLALAFFATIVIATEPIPLPAVAFIVVVMQVLLGLSQPDEVPKSVMSDAIFFIFGSMMLAVAIVKQHLDKRLAYLLLVLSGADVYYMAFYLMACSAFLSSLIGAYAVPMILLPIALSMVQPGPHAKPSHADRNVGFLMLTVVYGCSVGTMGTPSGGARNAMMLDYLNKLFHIHVSYREWMFYVYPILLVMVPVLYWVLRLSYPIDHRNISRAMVRLRSELATEGKMQPRDWGAVGIYGVTLFLWMFYSEHLGLGIPAFIGIALYLITGLITWNELNSGVNWGIIFIFAAFISLGISLKETGATDWAARQFLGFLGQFGVEQGLPLLMAISGLVILMVNAIGAPPAIATLGPIVLDVARLSDMNILIAGLFCLICSALPPLTLIGSPATMIAYSSGYLSLQDVWRIGWKMLLAAMGVLFLMVLVYWGWLDVIRVGLPGTA